MSVPFRVLLVEDNPGDVLMVRRALRDGTPPVTLAVANDGADALDLLQQAGEGIPDIILLDLNMPRMDGKMFLEAAKGDARLKAIPVVMLTSSESPGDVRDCYDRHANSYVVKPFEARDYADVVRRIVGHWSEIVRLPGSLPR